MKPRVLFVHNYPTKFVRLDLRLLQETYHVDERYLGGRFVNLPALLFEVARNDLVFGWFASWHTLFPVLFARALGRPSILVVGGYDTANLPDISYGHQRGGIKRLVSRMAMASATHLITNSCFARDEVVANVHIPPDRVTAIYHGLAFTPSVPDGRKQDLAVTVANVDRPNLQRKGLEAFVRAARFLEGIPIVLIGSWRDNAIEYLKSIASPNVRFTNWLSDAELEDYLTGAKAYVQASRHEGFGLAVAEAMLHECVPVVTRAGALPEVVGDCGIYVDSPEPEAIADGVRRAFKADDELGRRARERVQHEFPLSRRREQLNRLIDEALSHG